MYSGIFRVLHANLVTGNECAVRTLISIHDIVSDPLFWTELHNTPSLSLPFTLFVSKAHYQNGNQAALLASMEYLRDILPQNAPLQLTERVRYIIAGLRCKRNEITVTAEFMTNTFDNIAMWLRSCYRDSVFLLPEITSSTAAVPNNHNHAHGDLVVEPVAAVPQPRQGICGGSNNGLVVPMEVRQYDSFDDIPLDEGPAHLPRRRNKRTPQFTFEEDEAILAGVRQYGHRYQDVFNAKTHVWSEGRTPFHIEDRWKKLQKLL
eukprot:PhF_6_TR25799/c0_g1_i1/m.36406